MMKNTKNIFIKKNHIYLIICICILLIGMAYFITNNNNNTNNNTNTIKTIKREHFDVFAPIKDTDYLEPVKEIVSDDLWIILHNKMNKEYPDLQITEEKLREFTGFVTKKEINYYLTYKKFPWSTYVTNRFKEMIVSTISTSTDTESKTKINPDDMVNTMMQNFPNRYAFKQYIKSPAMTESLTSEQYLIYSGEKPAPTEKSQ